MFVLNMFDGCSHVTHAFSTSASIVILITIVATFVASHTDLRCLLRQPRKGCLVLDKNVNRQQFPNLLNH